VDAVRKGFWKTSNKLKITCDRYKQLWTKQMCCE